jgi:hypothetical protein
MIGGITLRGAVGNGAAENVRVVDSRAGKTRVLAEDDNATEVAR